MNNQPLYAGEILINKFLNQLPKARDYEEYCYILMCLDKATESFMWANKERIEAQAQIEAEIESMLQEVQCVA